ncbi:porin [Telluria mixta]|uniref:Porin n=1 Tax=Telluria mixta TaxID=34071 RepID=A0ABT2C1E2_9BURK|nr:porin [Telluria mixta]MCS0631146.1 porin [Telluria mixta]WEM95684.1 porin [Telluria mixta]
MTKQSMKTWIALSACVCGTACAQVSVTPYGVVDTAMEYQNGGAGSQVREVSSGLYATVYGFKGTENLGNGLHVNFQLEQGFDNSTGQASAAGTAFNRLAWVGLSGAFGELRVGRQKKPEYLLLNNESDPSGVKSIASPLNNFGDNAVRSSNALAYFTPTLYGFTEQFMVALREEEDKPTLLSYNAVVRYVNGPLHVLAGYEKTGTAGTDAFQKVWREVVSYGMGNARLYLAYQKESRSDGRENLQIVEVSGSWRFNPANQLSVMVGDARDCTGRGNGGRQLGLLYQYHLSRRTELYSAAGILQNRNQAQFTLDGTQYAGIPGAPGAFVRGMNLGIAHHF